MWDIQLIAAVLAVSAGAGFLAGLLGIGGGMVMVPVTLWVLHVQGLDSPHTQHIAIGTSFLVMVFTAFSSALAQHRKQAVRWDIVRGMVPGLMVGVITGAVLARFISAKNLQLFFIVFVTVVAIRTLRNIKPKPTRTLPSRGGMAAVGGIIGVISSWVGIGGGAMSMLAYSLVIWATTQAPVAVVSALRESSVLFALLIGWLLLKEPMPPMRLLACAVIALGVVLLKLA